MLRAQVDDVLEQARESGNLWIYAAIAAGVLIAILVLVAIARGRKKPPVDLEKGLREDLAEYPPPPASAADGPHRLLVNGRPVRLRLVVVAPTGKLQESILPDHVPALLDEVVRGLGQKVSTDRPRIKVWPPLLSVSGFAPTFHRLVQTPDADSAHSRWVKLAGPARTRKRAILLGLAFVTDEPSDLGNVVVETTEWGELLEVAR